MKNREELFNLWSNIGRDPVIHIPQYERCDLPTSQYYRSRITKYSFQGED